MKLQALALLLVGTLLQPMTIRSNEADTFKTIYLSYDAARNGLQTSIENAERCLSYDQKLNSDKFVALLICYLSYPAAWQLTICSMAGKLHFLSNNTIITSPDQLLATKSTILLVGTTTALLGSYLLVTYMILAQSFIDHTKAAREAFDTASALINNLWTEASTPDERIFVQRQYSELMILKYRLDALEIIIENAEKDQFINNCYIIANLATIGITSYVAVHHAYSWFKNMKFIKTA